MEAEVQLLYLVGDSILFRSEVNKFGYHNWSLDSSFQDSIAFQFAGRNSTEYLMTSDLFSTYSLFDGKHLTKLECFLIRKPDRISTDTVSMIAYFRKTFKMFHSSWTIYTDHC